MSCDSSCCWAIVKGGGRLPGIGGRYGGKLGGGGGTIGCLLGPRPSGLMTGGGEVSGCGVESSFSARSVHLSSSSTGVAGLTGCFFEVSSSLGAIVYSNDRLCRRIRMCCVEYLVLGQKQLIVKANHWGGMVYLCCELIALFCALRVADILI